MAKQIATKHRETTKVLTETAIIHRDPSVTDSQRTKYSQVRIRHVSL
jgi:hypothetical protein